MKSLRLFAMVFVVLSALLANSCRPETPPIVSLGIDDAYRIERLRAFELKPAFSGEAYRWTLTAPDGTESLVSTDRDFTFWAAKEGLYHLTFEVIDPRTPYKHTAVIDVVHELVEYSPYIAKVLEFRPAPGQFINTSPKWKEGMSEADLLRITFEVMGDQNNGLISLGGYGGYVTFAFDHIVPNLDGKDFFIHGNAFYSDDPKYAERKGGSCEPGIVMVSFDSNLNGLPDDEWYELAGSEYYKPETIHNYSITYFRPDPNKQPVLDETQPYVTDATYIRWEDNQGNSGYIPKNVFHAQNYYPDWIKEDSYTLHGTKLKNNGIEESGNGTYWVQYSFPWGYVDNQPVSESNDLNDFDISWAVDKHGQPVQLRGIHFVRVYTAINQVCGWLGENSTEFSQAYDLRLKKEQEPILPNP